MAEYKYVRDEFASRLPEGHRITHLVMHPDGLGMNVTVAAPVPEAAMGLTLVLERTKAVGALVEVTNTATWSIRFKDWSKEPT